MHYQEDGRLEGIRVVEDGGGVEEHGKDDGGAIVLQDERRNGLQLEYTLPVVHQERRDVRDGHRSMSVTMKCDVWTLAIPRLRILFTGKWL